MDVLGHEYEVANALYAHIADGCSLTQVKRLHLMSLFMQEAHSENYKFTLRP